MKDEQEKSRPRGPGGDPRSHAQMGYLLRQVYGTVITEPVPDRFSALLEQLAQNTEDKPAAKDATPQMPAKEAL